MYPSVQDAEQNIWKWFNGCGTVGREPWFESSHQNFLIVLLNKENEAWNGPF